MASKLPLVMARTLVSSGLPLVPFAKAQVSVARLELHRTQL